MNRMIVGVAAALILTAGQAAAEGLAPPTSRIKAPGPVGPRWTGFYIGAGVGAGVLSQEVSGKQDLTRTLTRTASRTKTKTVNGCNILQSSWYHCICKQTTEEYTEYYTEEYTENYTEAFKDSDTGDVGVFGTVVVGYDRQFRPGWVGGVFADYDFGSNISANVSLPGNSGSVEQDYAWSIGGRLGFLATDSTLVYGTGGYTQTNLGVSHLGSKTYDGFFVGAGVETFLKENVTLRLEYRYSQFGSETIVDDGGLKADLEPSTHSARLVLSYKLGNPN